MSDFKMANTPREGDASDSLIEKLFEGEIKRAEALAGAFDRLEEVMHEPPDRPTFNAETLANGRVNEARRFDLTYDYASYRPEAERWICIDLNTYDGGIDAEKPNTFVGRGASEKEARMNLLDQFSEFDGVEPRPSPPTRTINHSPFEPPEVIDDVTFDDDLEDRDER